MNASMQPERDRRERSRPKSISVVIPAYNAAATLAEQLLALATQQYEDERSRPLSTARQEAPMTPARDSIDTVGTVLLTEA